MTREVRYAPRAHQQLRALYDWIADEGTPERGERFVSSIYDFCDGLADFPLIGVSRDDLHPGMRVIGFHRRATIVFVVKDETVTIHGVYYGGRDYETLVQDALSDDEP